MTSRYTLNAVVAGTLALCSSASSASDWMTSKMKGKAERVYISSHPFYDVERCVVFSDARAWLYRVPDRPDESYVISAHGNFTRPALWQLQKLPSGAVRLSVFEGEDNVNADTEACFDKRES